MLNHDVYGTMLEDNEAWFVWSDGAALLLGCVHTDVALEC